jgi:hypothetical protein
MRCSYHLATAVQSEKEWEPALGTYGWLWITLAGTAGFVGYKFVRRRMDQTDTSPDVGPRMLHKIEATLCNRLS